MGLSAVSLASTTLHSSRRCSISPSVSSVWTCGESTRLAFRQAPFSHMASLAASQTGLPQLEPTPGGCRASTMQSVQLAPGRCQCSHSTPYRTPLFRSTGPCCGPANARWTRCGAARTAVTAPRLQGRRTTAAHASASAGTARRRLSRAASFVTSITAGMEADQGGLSHARCAQVTSMLLHTCSTYGRSLYRAVGAGPLSAVDTEA
mmetsp:Transcript_73615/g.163625  ORF Transcript_73615/g.163625 Transcript_73615/m.163625 type:complete len:206 (-) Transcript_73615:320-937(-)